MLYFTFSLPFITASYLVLGYIYCGGIFCVAYDDHCFKFRYVSRYDLIAFLYSIKKAYCFTDLAYKDCAINKSVRKC